ncbi:hypothetical protein X769_04390 [Mesorhizobium sp. LSJC268A00]|nr:hypothetical protein X768_29865 [Mesorhizobium sp. LSJC265A00]ESX07154.1 hypothetical protein X769_04390 [Mesorhizobium sp. LSJC268A00]ESY14298.1 hypothetical protein X751_27425 [Mesorhizobium sp. LNJC395A00]ESZ17713.1 hypothetical protein X735_10720 [Mesorhizobium sp. L2C085B000]ESZ31232.1 hypothetical protein X733_22115 [Mesorhizobium sp. L2C067A000]ESZ38747.1 hypothetical protein X732_17065 [Mesorhizobium sp. L2C066B000]ESZ64730.1 hypothetical protein X729_04185 [Mesorhizobium sp. L103C
MIPKSGSGFSGKIMVNRKQCFAKAEQEKNNGR